MNDYTWPGPFKPYSHQVATAKHLAARKRAFCFNDIGTGKTNAAMWAADWLRNRGAVNATVIVCPKSTMHHVWSRAYFIGMPHIKVAVLDQTGVKRKEIFNDGEHDVYIINPAGLSIIENCSGWDRVDLIVVDESTMFKDKSTRRYKTLRKLAADRGLWMMSGEPMPQAITDLYAPCTLICPDDIPMPYGKFQMTYQFKVGMYKWVTKAGAEQELAKRIEPHVIRFTRDDCLDLPPATYDTIEVEQSRAHTKVLSDLKQQALSELDDGAISAVNEGVHVNKMLQAACGAVKYVRDDGTGGIHWINVMSKLRALDEVIQFTRGPLIVFSPFLAPLHLLATYYKDTSHRVVYGNTSPKDRAKAFDLVQDGKIKLLLAQPRAMSHGITLTTSNTIVWWGLPFSNETYTQACGRIIRSGQQRHQYIVHLLNSNIERILYERIKKRKALQGALLEVLKGE